MRRESKIETPQPMDNSAPEAAIGTVRVNNHRMCWAMQTLIAEVEALFPETNYETSNIDGRNTAHDVTFDLSMLAPHEVNDLSILLTALDGDERVRDTIAQDDMVLVSFVANARLKDKRDPFRLADAYDVLTEDESW